MTDESQIGPALQQKTVVTLSATGEVQSEVLERAVAYLRSP